MRLLSTSISPNTLRISLHHAHPPSPTLLKRPLTTTTTSSPQPASPTLPSYFSNHRYRTAFYASTLFLGALTIYLDHKSSKLRTESALNYHNRLFFEYKTELMLLHVARLNAKRAPVTTEAFMGEGMEETRRGVESSAAEPKPITKADQQKGKSKSTMAEEEVDEDEDGESSRARMLLAAMSRTGVTHEKAMEKVRRDREALTADYERRRQQSGWTKMFNG